MREKDEERTNETFNTIHLNDVKKMLGITGDGFRTAVAWCKKNNILIIGNGKMKRILQSDWIRCQKVALIKAAHEAGLHLKDFLKERNIDIRDLNEKSNISYHSKSKLSAKFLNDEV